MAKQLSFYEQLRRAVDADTRSRYALCKATGIAEASMSKMMAGTGGLSRENLDRLINELGLVLVKRSALRKKRD
ncbi:helix-turn-helix domain-containing protein [Mucisphaera sp.]|uniref:helix-turn-helix domain-containing protein n=1 Tax=Mucisphaera sp. TaxID=2913024 RepID=UPI003D0DBE87